MLRTLVAGLRAHPGRLIATVLAVALGVSFAYGTMIFGDTVKVSFFDQFARAARDVDAVVLPPGQDRAAVANSDGGPALPVGCVAAVRRVSGVAAAEGRYSTRLPLLDRRGTLLRNGNDVGYAISAGTDPLLRPYDIVTGRAPSTADEAAVDEKTASRAGFPLGAPVTVLDADQRRHTVTLVGTFTLAAPSLYSGNSVVALTDRRLAALTRPSGYAEIVVRATAAVEPAALTGPISAALVAGPATVARPPTVLTGDQRRTYLADKAIGDVDMVLFALSIFGLVALVVAGFVIFNTFTILVAQRVRELALLRCVGASRRQIFESVLLESLIVGLAGGAAGVLIGLGIAYALFKAFGWIGMSLPYHPPVLRGFPLLVALGVGMAVTMVSAAVPAARATRIAPLAALRTDPNAGIRSLRGRLLRVSLAGLAVLAGGVASGAGAANPELPGGVGPGSTSEMLVVGGGVAVFLGLLIATPLFIGPLTMLLGALPALLFGTPVRLATANGRRNPARAAVTTATLMVGVGLMSVFSVMMASTTATFAHKLAAELPVDYGLQSADAGAVAGRPAVGSPGSGVPAAALAALRTRPEFDRVIAVYSVDGTLDGRRTTVGALDRKGMDLLVPNASTGALNELRPGTVALAENHARDTGKRVGDTVRVVADGRSATYRVIATVPESTMTAAVLLDPDEYADLYRRDDPDAAASVLLRAAPGVRGTESRAAVDAIVAGYPLLEVRSVADYREELTDQINGLLGFFAGLLGVTFLIALVGIANTLSLSIVERTRESAVLRALGLSRRQLGVTVLVEALLLAGVGAVLGVSFGLVYGMLLARATLPGSHTVFSVPVGQLLAYVGLAALAGALAAILPASRAQRGSVVTAMADD